MEKRIEHDVGKLGEKLLAYVFLKLSEMGTNWGELVGFPNLSSFLYKLNLQKISSAGTEDALQVDTFDVATLSNLA